MEVSGLVPCLWVGHVARETQGLSYLDQPWVAPTLLEMLLIHVNLVLLGQSAHQGETEASGFV